jgi:hypothetical protein
VSRWIAPTNEYHQGVRSIEQIHSRLRATLVAGNIPVTDEALSTLSAGLTTIGHGYHIEKVISGEAKTETQLGKELSRVDAAFRTAVDILDADLSGTGQIEALLSDPWRGSQIPRVVEELRLLSSRIEPPLATLSQDKAIKKRQQNPETWFFLAIHDLFATITGNPEPGIAGPLQRFTKCCAALIDARIAVPESENSFQKRLTAALDRRTGKINVVAKVIFPGK